MPDDRSKRGKQDRIRINIKQAFERTHWARKFGITQAHLRLAVKAVGPMVRDVKAWLVMWIEET